MAYASLLITGIEEDLILIRDRLCGEQSVNLEIIPIVGMGGIGKTTLATHAYHHPSTFDHFDIRVWVTVSRNSSLRKILLGILYSFGSYSVRDEDSEFLLQHTYKYFKGRRYLVVLDDIWDTNLWDDVTRAFPDDSNGSRIMVTTRELNVASYVNSRGCPHEMRLMSEDQSWRLLKGKVFGQESCPLELENVGKLIAQNCRGLPLAIVVIAGVLSKVSRMQETWEKIASNVIEAVHNDQQFSDILSVSYNNLPCHLRPCFLYMGGFPEDHEIKVSRLIKLWAAEGFLISKDMEELGYEYLEELAKRSLVLIGKKRYDGKIKTIKIHDVLRDLCIRKAGDDKFLCIINEFSGSFPQGIENSHRLSILSNVLSCIPNRDNATIRTLLLFNHWALYYWKDLRLLRVVDANAMNVTLSSSDALRHVGELSHLTHLAFTCESTVGVARQVVESLYQLHNLQTLIARIKPDQKESQEHDGVVIFSVKHSCLTEADLHTTTLQLEIWRMPQLSHLILLDGILTNPSPETCQENVVLENLHTLSRIEDFTCSERMLEMIPNLRKMRIQYSYKSLYESGWSKYGLNNLVHLSKLEKLSLYADPYPYLRNDISQNLAFPLSLKALTLSGCSIPWEDMALVGSLPNLQMLKLKRHACVGMEWETMEGQFCELKQLLIDTTDLHHWIVESSSHFPRLERLVLYVCHKLKEIPLQVGEITTLELMEVDRRDSLVVQSAISIQEKQQSFGNDLQVRLLKSRTWKR